MDEVTIYGKEPTKVSTTEGSSWVSKRSKSNGCKKTNTSVEENEEKGLYKVDTP